MNNQMSKSVDHTVDGKCSGCGQCCSALLILSQAEINRIHSYLKQHPEVELHNRNSVLETQFKDICPFLTDEKRCGIYEVRPEICQGFICSNYGKLDATKFSHVNKKIVNMITTFMPKSPCSNAPDLGELNDFYAKKKREAYGRKV